MVDLVIVYVDKQEGGAYQAMRYAQRQSKELVVLREDETKNYIFSV